MFQRQFGFIYLFILFVGGLSQQVQENSNDRFVNRQRRQETNISNTNNKNSDQQASRSNSVGSSTLPFVSFTLAASQECRADIQKYCNRGGRTLLPNLKVLQCTDDLDNAVNLISKECQNIIYRYKYNMTHDIRFDNAAMRFCDKDIKLLEECNEHTDERGSGRLVACLYEKLTNITEPKCQAFIKQIQSIVFTDWRLSESFATACLKDITELKCGRIDDDNETLPHDQGAVVSCLSKNDDNLSKECLKHITRLTEMQSDDYHLDRALYYACRDDRERLCSQVASGNGRVYRCLYEQKFNNMMSKDCREEVHRRQKMVASNALIDAPLIRACKNEMTEHNCNVTGQDGDKKVSLTNLLTCLEARLKSGSQINDECRRQMLMHRRMLMSDYALSPKIVSQCNKEMIQHCSSLYQKGISGTIDARGGRMIHCLLSAARKEKNFSSECLKSIKSLVQAVDPGNDVRADPLLETTCRPVIDALCSKVKPGDSNVIMCLLDNLKNTRMTEECEDRLMEVSYFMVRDWRLTPRLASSCRKDLIAQCELPENMKINDDMKDVEIGQYLSCLYQARTKLHSECRTELKRLMRIRAQSIGLMPEIEDNCIQDLATCNDPEVKGEEMKCLQKKYKKLEDQCKEAVKKYTKMTMSDPTLDFPLMKACEPMIQLFCSNIESGNENNLLRCLIKNKNNPKMDYRCKAGVEHHQIISLRDAAFLSESFKKNCKTEIDTHCSEKTTKASIVQCLANLILKDVLKKQNEITPECRDELKFELLQRSESIDFDPLLARACRSDIRKYCADRNPGNAQILDCLKENRNKVSSVCFNKLKSRERIDVILPGNDYSLTTKCSSVIQKFCANENKQNILSCLRRNANQDTMTPTCRNVLYHRLMVLNSDARFNKGLIENCQNDVTKYCANEIIDDDGHDDDDNDDDQSDDDNPPNQLNEGETKDRDMGGRIIGCLRTRYANKNIDLDPKCLTELIDVIESSKLDIQLDVKLYQKCKNIVNSNCPGLEKEDCLKLLYQNNKLEDEECKTEVIRIIKEGRADIHVDQSLIIACQADIIKYCNDIPIGAGKQLQCLIKVRSSLTNSCQKVLSKRQELWSSISDIDDFDDLAKHIMNSSNNKYFYGVIFLVVFVIFFAGCCSRPLVRYRRISKYK